ncbi:MAG: Rieske 2Fe-2S domain-containing protein [bacterium]|jgi:phenylpropionate dioxygenase-like ring-hydroxylating dioxygenase large terminal subunit|nr:aromatic ring-hydroxylating dioxygenase subunit alpha [Betaproteobacteria bacterium]
MAAGGDTGDRLLRHWYALCRSRDLGHRAPLPVRLFGRRLVAFRGEGGRPAALHDRCVHRQAPLSAGRVCAARLQCPYHGWAYDGSGRVVQVPALGPGQVPEGLRVASLPCVEQDGLVWTWPGEGEPDRPPPRVPTCDEPGWTRFIMKTRFRGTVEACLENFLDCPHATFVHRGWFRSPTGVPVTARVTSLPDGAQAEYFGEPRRRSVIWAMFSPPGGTMQHVDRFIAPATSRVDYVFPNGLAYNITSTCSPVEGDAIEVYTVMSFRFRGLGPLVRLFFEPLSRWIIRQDVRMLDRVADNRAADAAAGAPPARSTEADLLGESIWRWRAALARGEPPPAAGAVRDVRLVL